MKKILIAILIALAVILLFQIDFFDIIENISITKRENTIKDCPISLGDKTVSLGMDELQVKNAFGEPCDTLLSEYGFMWNIYHENFKNYIQIGIKDGIVVGMYTNSPSLSFEGFLSGTKKEDIRAKFGAPLDGIIKGNMRYLSNGDDENTSFETYKIRGSYVTFFYDVYEHNSLSCVNIIDCDVEEGFKMLYAPASYDLKESFEKQNFYVTNATRVKFGLSPFKEHEGLLNLARDHSQDMAENSYFNHISQNGDSVLNRAKKHGIKFKTIGENLAMGSQNSLYMHGLLMNSEGHRKNILGNFTHMGVGVSFADNDLPYLTQNFLK